MNHEPSVERVKSAKRIIDDSGLAPEQRLIIKEAIYPLLITDSQKQAQNAFRALRRIIKGFRSEMPLSEILSLVSLLMNQHSSIQEEPNPPNMTDRDVESYVSPSHNSR